MLRACFTYVWVFLGATAAVSVGAYVWNPIPSGFQDGQITVAQARIMASAGIGSTSAFFLAIGLAFLHGTANCRKEWQLIKASLAGRPPEDGQRMAAVGLLRTDGPALEAPLSRRQCAIYHYEIDHPASGDSIGDVLDYWGYGLTASRIETVAGGIRLLAYADLDFAQEEIDPAQALPHAQRHLEATEASATRVEPLGIGKGVRDLRQLLADDDGSIVADFRLPGFTRPGLDCCHFKERLVRDGEDVCAFGYYDVARGGFAPRPGCPEVFPIRLMRGKPHELARRLRNKATYGGCLAIPFLALALGVLVVAWFLHQLFR
jgi:hypothetical protein